MKPLQILLTALCAIVMQPAGAWSNHTLVAYRALEKMPEVAQAAPVTVEPIEAFLKAQEPALERLLAEQEAWARANVTAYAPRPDALAFRANPARPDDARRLAFLMALRVSPNSKLALYVQPDPRSPAGDGPALPFGAVSFLPEQPNTTYRFIGLQAGATVPVLQVVASASDEPDYGLDINLWEDSPSDWGKVYGFGKLPFGNPALYYATQAPFHMGFYHQDWLIYQAAPFLKRTLPLLRTHQYTTLAALAFRTGHTYWGWRFTGLALHYVQDLTQPYHANLAPGDSTFRMISANVLAMAGLPRQRDDLIVLLSNRHLALEKYQNERLLAAARAAQDTPLETALRRAERDASYPAWSDLYPRDVVASQSSAAGVRTAAAIVAAMPPGFVSDPSFDFGVKESGIDLTAAMAKQDPARRAELDALVAELLENFGSHSRNTIRGVLKAGARP
ncbi:MAG: hypothetical protein U1F00_13085 [Rhodoferax sp.]